MKTVADKDAIKAITTHYIDGAFVESHGREVMDIIRPTDGKVIAPRHAGRRGGYAARHRGSQARVRDVRPDDEGRAREHLAPPARGRFGAHR